MLKSTSSPHTKAKSNPKCVKPTHSLRSQQRKAVVTRKKAQQRDFSTATNTSTPPQPHKNDPKLFGIRNYLRENNIDALLVPLADPHLSEYVPEHDKRLEFISEFDGSAGTALITPSEAMLWTDARYFIQADQQLSPQWTLMKQGLPETPSITKWCESNLKRGQRFAIDPWNISIKQAKGFNEDLSVKNGIDIVPVARPNLIDRVWGEHSANLAAATSTDTPHNIPQPKLPFNQMRIFEHAGEDMSSKLAKLRAKMYQHNAKAMVVVALDEIAWLTNLRGSDVEFNPVFLSYAIITHDSLHLFVDPKAVEESSNVMKHLRDQGNVVIHPYDSIGDFASKLGDIEVDIDAVEATHQTSTNGATTTTTTTQSETKPKKSLHKIWVDHDKTNYALLTALGFGDIGPENHDLKKRVIFEANPIGVLKATKNKTEIAAMKAAHLRDGAAVVKFLSWFETQYCTLPCITADEATQSNSPLNEYTLAVKLDEFRQKEYGYLGPSFDTISSIGPNGAIIHYKPDSKTSSPLTRGQVFLLDSGGSYLDATTDITRTFFIPSQQGTKPFTKAKNRLDTDADAGSSSLIDPTVPTAFQKEVFTRVLQGHVNIATAIWPPGTAGPVLDAFARAPLWESGLDCPHGIGHGVGAGINVHEGPIGITKPSRISTALGIPLVEGMILSNEPGYYKDGDFGVRIENLVNVVPKQTKFGPKLTPSDSTTTTATTDTKPKTTRPPYLGFDNLTMVPLDRTMIEMDLMRPLDIKYVNEYHQQVLAVIAPLVGDDAVATEWLVRNTQPL